MSAGPASFAVENKVLTRSELSVSVRRYIKEKEEYLDRRCGKIFEATNVKGERFIFARFNRGRKDHIIVTLAAYVANVGFVGMMPGNPV